MKGEVVEFLKVKNGLAVFLAKLRVIQKKVISYEKIDNVCIDFSHNLKIYVIYSNNQNFEFFLFFSCTNKILYRNWV